MSVILNLETKNETLNNVISNNPFYIDIKGSVNICLVRCGQEIEDCESVNFSTMTNYGKILVLNKSNNSNSKCAIKLAFDSSNDTINNKGDANYNFETAFVTVPSLHKLNGVIYDMETCLVFSSIQKNGNILYVCLCTFNMGVNSVPQGDWKLLNYKLMDELFAQKNIVPDIYGTNEITGIPNPVDLNNFIPKKGFRNFYDYTHPQNTKVNFRIFQTPLSVSNNVINTLKSKLTPGNTYVNFKNAISQTINPIEGLFFYFSEDLTDRYKSFSANKTIHKTDHLKENLEEDLEEETNENILKKLDVIGDEESLLEENNSFDEENKNKESFQANNNQNKAFTTYIIFLLISVFCMTSIYTYLIKNFFKNGNGISEDDLVNYTNDIFNSNMTKVIASKFKITICFLIQFILTFVIIFLLVISIPLNNNNSNINPIFNTAFLFIILLIIIIVILFYYYFKYLFFRIKGLVDDDFSQKENYLYNFIKNKIYNRNFISNLLNIINEDFTNFLINIPSQNLKYNNIQSGGNNDKFNHAPGIVNDLTNQSIKNEQNKKIFDEIDNFSLENFLKLINNDFVKKKFIANKQYINSFYLIVSLIVIFYVFGSILQLTFSSIGDNRGIKLLVSLLTSFVLYLPICFMLINFVYSSNNNNLKYIIYIICLIIILLSFFTIFLKPINNLPTNNIGFWLTFSLIIISIIIIYISKIIKSPVQEKSVSLQTSSNKTDEFSLLQKINMLQSQLIEEKSKTTLLENYFENNIDYDTNKNEENEENKENEENEENKENEENEKNKENEIYKLQNKILQMKNNFNSKTTYYKILFNQFENSKKEIDILKKLIYDQKLGKSLEYLKLISSIFSKLQKLSLSKDELNHKEEILTLLNQLNTIDQSSNIPNGIEEELKKLSENNKENYQFVINNLYSIINKIKEVAQTVLNNLHP